MVNGQQRNRIMIRTIKWKKKKNIQNDFIGENQFIGKTYGTSNYASYLRSFMVAGASDRCVCLSYASGK